MYLSYQAMSFLSRLTVDKEYSHCRWLGWLSYSSRPRLLLDPSFIVATLAPLQLRHLTIITRWVREASCVNVHCNSSAVAQ